MIFVDESIQSELGYICVGFVYCEVMPDEAVYDALRGVGLVPGIDEYKSGYRMEDDPARHKLRDSISEIVLNGCKLAVYVAPLGERTQLLEGVQKTLEMLVRQNNLPVPQTVFVDEGISGSVFESAYIKLLAECDSKKVPGIQLADFAAHLCAYLLRCAISGKSKAIVLDDAPDPYLGQEADLDWLMRTTFRRHFFVEEKSVESFLDGDWLYKLAGYGAFISPALDEEKRVVAEAIFDSMYFGCVL